jgi:hypothetical protein
VALVVESEAATAAPVVEDGASQGPLDLSADSGSGDVIASDAAAGDGVDDGADGGADDADPDEA